MVQSRPGKGTSPVTQKKTTKLFSSLSISLFFFLPCCTAVRLLEESPIDFSTVCGRSLIRVRLVRNINSQVSIATGQSCPAAVWLVEREAGVVGMWWGCDHLEVNAYRMRSDKKLKFWGYLPKWGCVCHSIREKKKLICDSVWVNNVWVLKYSERVYFLPFDTTAWYFLLSHALLCVKNIWKVTLKVSLKVTELTVCSKNVGMFSNGCM